MILTILIGKRNKRQWEKFHSKSLYIKTKIIVETVFRRTFVHGTMFMNQSAINKKRRERYKKNKNKLKGSYVKRYGLRLVKRDGRVCKKCGIELIRGENMTVDHIIPLSKGGSNMLSNLQLLCDKCNMDKADSYTQLT